MVEVVPRIECGVAMEVIPGTVDVVGSRLDSDVHHDPRLLAVIRLRLLFCVEFLNGIERKVAGGRAGNAFLVENGGAPIRIVIVGSVNHEVVIVGTKAVGSHRMETASRRALHAGMECQQILEVSPLDGQFVDRLVRQHAF